MKHLGIAFLTYFALVLQVGWSDRLAIRGIEPALLPLMLAFVIFAFEGAAAIAWAGVIGLLSDSVATEGLGIDMLSATLLAYIGTRMLAGRKRETNSAVVAAGPFVVSAFLIVEAFLLFSTGARMLSSRLTADPTDLFKVTAASAAYTASIALLLLAAARMAARLLPQTDPALR